MAPARYTVAFVALLFLTAASFAASYLHLGDAEVPVALGIACIKASVVVLIFMHLAGGVFAYRLALLIGVIFVGIMLAFTLLDYFTRGAPITPA
jgi:cytochrome c oxidase subunit IV